jgi:hypothetical protein
VTDNAYTYSREIRSDGQDEQAGEEGGADSSKTEIEDIDELAPSTSTASTSAPVEPGASSSSSVQPSPDSSNASRAVDPKLRNITGGLELLPNRKEGGLIKKTISVAGLHMISCECKESPLGISLNFRSMLCHIVHTDYTAEEVIAGRLKQPISIPELANIDISHPFLMAQFFRHPPQVTFDADQMPHFAGITDDEPMIRKPAANPRKKKTASEQLTPSAMEASLPRPSDLPFQTISHDPPVSSANHPPRTSLSPVAHHQQPQPHHMISSPVHDQSFSSVLSHVPTNVNPLLPPVRPGTGSRSSTSMSVASASDTSSPRIRSSISHANRHEPYRVPIPRHRYSITEQTQNIQQEHASSPYPYPRQGSLPNPGMDYYREGIHQVASGTFAPPIPYSAGHYSAPIASSSNNNGNNGNSEYSYTLGGPQTMHDVPWQTAHQAILPSDSPRSFYSTASSLQTGQLATGEPPNVTIHQSTSHAPIYTRGQIAQPGYSHPIYGGPDFYNTTPPVNMEVPHSLATRPWYDQAVEEQPVQMNAMHLQNMTQSQPQHLLAPQAVQHLAGFLPETGYSPLLPSSAAYASDQMVQQEQSHTESTNIKTEAYNAGKHHKYEHPQGAYITAPPPPSYAHPNQSHQEDVKPDHLAVPQYGVRTYQSMNYPAPGVYDPSMNDPRDAS